MNVAEICAAFDLGVPTGPSRYVARGELGRVCRLDTTSGAWAVKEIELFVPTVDEADENVALQESMLSSGVNLPRPRRTRDGHGLFGNVRVYEWLDMAPIAEGDQHAEGLVAEALALIHLHAPPTGRTSDLWYCESIARDQWDELVEHGTHRWWASTVARLVPELTDLARPDHTPARICHLDVCPENTFLCDDRLTVIDWENAGPAATDQDLGSTLWDFFRGDVARTRAFVDRYREHGGPLDRFDAAVFDTARVVQANLIEFHCRRDLDPSGTFETRQRAEQSLRGCLVAPLTRAVIDAIVGLPG